jgi:AraC-like DNA-binding protein
MTNGKLRRVLAHHLVLDAAGSGLVAVQEFRSVLVSAHRPRGATWAWSTRPQDQSTTAVMFAVQGQVALSANATTDASARGVLIDSGHLGTVGWSDDALAVIVWVDSDTLRDPNLAHADGPVSLPDGPLTDGFLAFAHSLVQHSSKVGSVSAYVVERLLVEMSFGLLLERNDALAAHSPSPRTDPLHEARKLILLNRADPGYDIHALARDLHMSVRHVQRLFAAGGASPATVLRAMRAELAHSLLTDPQFRALTVAEIAEHSGFTNAAAMRRALASEGLAAPVALRAG